MKSESDAPADPRLRTVAPGEADLRLDRWFRRHFPDLSHIRLERLLRTGQVRVDGRRVKAGERLAPGQQVRIPPLDQSRPSAAPNRERKPPTVSDADAEMLQGLVLYRDADVIAINKPAGMAVQGGTGTTRHLDAMLDAVRFDSPERPRLVHRLDRDTSGVLLLARTRQAADRLGKIFRSRDIKKVYWALTVGVPKPTSGRIDLALAKGGSHGNEKVGPDPEEGKPAVTDYVVVETAGKHLAWVALWPRTGRTHQLRAHLAALGTPILGDGKYGGPAAQLPGIEIPRKLHLHARAIALPHPSGRGSISVVAALPAVMAGTMRTFNFDPDWRGDPFADQAGLTR